MLLIPCPHCGPRARDRVPLRRRGAHPPARPRPADRRRLGGLPVPAHEPERPACERWCHVHGCRRWFNAARDTVTDRFLASTRWVPRRPRPSCGADCREGPALPPARGRPDRPRAGRSRFSFDGRRYEGCAGDTLASALLANGVHLVGRSFKYHRPRGILSAGAEEPNALIQLERPGGRSDPNMRATEHRALRRAESPTARTAGRRCASTCGAVNDLLSPAVPGRLLLQDLHGPGELLAPALRAAHPRRRRPGPGAGRARSRPLPAPPRALRRAGRRRRPGRA